MNTLYIGIILSGFGESFLLIPQLHEEGRIISILNFRKPKDNKVEKPSPTVLWPVK